jgi:hypothetical protein
MVPYRSRWFTVPVTVVGALSVAWVLQCELIQGGAWIATSVPPIPALVALLLFAAVAARRSGARWRAAYPAARVFSPYLLVSVATAVASMPALWIFFAYVTVSQYLGMTQPALSGLAAHLPAWLAPPSGEAIRQFYEGGGNGAIPWNVWWGPLLAWGGLLFTLLLTLYALLTLLSRPWLEEERLACPLNEMPLRLAGGDARYMPLWRNPVFWVGFALSAGFDGINMANAFYPSLPTMGIDLDIAGWLVSLPWSALSPLSVSYRPEILGIAYLMPTDVLLTTSLSYLALRLSSVARAASGELVASSPYDYTEIGMGAFVALFVLLLSRAGPDLARSLREAVRRPAGLRRDEPLSPRAAWLIVGGGMLAMTVWLCLAGLPLWLSALHLLLLTAVAVVYARMRAETGAPMAYLFPFWQQQHLIYNLFGATLPGGDRTVAVFAALGGLSRGNFPEISAIGPEGINLAARARFPQRYVTYAMAGGVTTGLLVGGYLCLTACYRHGANQLQGMFHVQIATQQYSRALAALPPKMDLVAQTAIGGAVVLLLGALRQRFFWISLHPMGFAMVSAYGYHLWAPFLLAWTVKKMTLRLAGHAGYLRLMPLFLGLAIGRYLFGGLVWGILGALDHPATRAYQIQFG